MIGERALRLQLEHAEASLDQWRPEHPMSLAPTEPDEEQRTLIREGLRAQIATLRWTLGITETIGGVPRPFTGLRVTVINPPPSHAVGDFRAAHRSLVCTIAAYFMPYDLPIVERDRRASWLVDGMMHLLATRDEMAKEDSIRAALAGASNAPTEPAGAPECIHEGCDLDPSQLCQPHAEQDGYEKCERDLRALIATYTDAMQAWHHFKHAFDRGEHRRKAG